MTCHGHSALHEPCEIEKLFEKFSHFLELKHIII